MKDIKNIMLSHPGNILAKELEQQRMSRKELAVRTGFTEKHISTIIGGQRNISPSFAKKLEYALGVPLSEWLKFQNAYDEALLEYEEQNHISEEEFEILKPLKDILAYMNQISILPNGLGDVEKIVYLRRFLRISSLESVTKIPYNAAYRAQISNNATINPYVLYVWQYVCESLATKIETNQLLDKELLKDSLPDIKKIMFVKAASIYDQLVKIFAQCGIAFHIIKHFRGAPVQGFIKTMRDGRLMMALTLRQARADIFWFSLFHEIAHVFNGDANDRFVDFSSIKSESEAKADKMARDILIDNADYILFVKGDDFSESAIKSFAETQNVPPYIVVGRLQSDELIGWNQHTDMLIKYEWIKD